MAEYVSSVFSARQSSTKGRASTKVSGIYTNHQRDQVQENLGAMASFAKAWRAAPWRAGALWSEKKLVKSLCPSRWRISFLRDTDLQAYILRDETETPWK